MHIPSLTDFKAYLGKKILSCTEAEIRFAFHALNFTLKEFRQNQGMVSFEIHFTRYFIMKVEVSGGLVTFSNEWILFDDNNTHHVIFSEPENLMLTIQLFFDIFGTPLLDPLKYGPTFIKGWSVFENEDQHDDYLAEMYRMLPNYKPQIPLGSIARNSDKKVVS